MCATISSAPSPASVTTAVISPLPSKRGAEHRAFFEYRLVLSTAQGKLMLVMAGSVLAEPAYRLDRQPRAPFRTMVMNRTCSSGLSWKVPVKVDVRVVEPCLRMPRMAMHICSASIMTATPRGFSTSWMTPAICAVMRLLRLQAVRKDVDDAGDLRQADHLAIRQVADMRLADDRHHVVLAMRDELDVLDDDHVVIAGDFLEGAAELVGRAHVVAGEHLAIGLGHALRRIHQAFAVRIVAGPAQQRAHGCFDFGLGGRSVTGLSMIGGWRHEFLDHGSIKASPVVALKGGTS